MTKDSRDAEKISGEETNAKEAHFDDFIEAFERELRDPAAIAEGNDSSVS